MVGIWGGDTKSGNFVEALLCCWQNCGTNMERYAKLLCDLENKVLIELALFFKKKWQPL